MFADAAGDPYPRASASYTFGGDDVAPIDDGVVIDDRSANGSPNNANLHNRWTSYQSPHAKDWVQIDLGAPASLDDVTLDLYDDGGGVTAPAGYAIATSDAAAAWTPVAGLVA